VYTAKPKKNKTKKRKARPFIADTEPIKTIEIIRSQPEEKFKFEKFPNKPATAQTYQPKTTLEQVPAEIALPSSLASASVQPNKNSKAKRKAKERQ